MSSTPEIEQARDWLRMDGDYTIVINLHGLYGCYKVEGMYLNQQVVYSLGSQLDKHILKVLAELKLHRADRLTKASNL